MGFFAFFKEEQPPLIDQAFCDVQSMLQNGHEMFAAATAFLLDNEILEVDLKALDNKINHCEQSLRRGVLEHLTIDPNRELIFSLKLISIVHEAERIGDLAKSLAKTADLAKRPRMGPVVTPLREIRNRILTMFEYGLKGFVEGDASAARRLMKDHEQLKDEVANYLQTLAGRDDLTGNEGVVYALSARMMSRVSSHLANIASTVASPFDQIRRSTSWAEEKERAA